MALLHTSTDGTSMHISTDCTYISRDGSLTYLSTVDVFTWFRHFHAEQEQVRKSYL